MIERCPFRLTLAKDSLQVFSNLLVSKVRNDSNGAQRSNRLNDWNLELNSTGRSAADVEFHTCDPIRVDLCKLSWHVRPTCLGSRPLKKSEHALVVAHRAANFYSSSFRRFFIGFAQLDM